MISDSNEERRATLTLNLLVFGIDLADHPNAAMPADDLTLFTNLLY
jgi:hypothetical protein